MSELHAKTRVHRCDGVKHTSTLGRPSSGTLPGWTMALAAVRRRGALLNGLSSAMAQRKPAEDGVVG